MPSGDVMARATGGVKNRSRNERAIRDRRLLAPVVPSAAHPNLGQKFETTAVKTSLMVAGFEATYSAPLDASAMRRSVAVSASSP